MEHFRFCWKLYSNNKFVSFINEAEQLIANWPSKDVSVRSMFGIFFLHVWLINAFFAVGRVDCVMSYVKQMEQLFSGYPFIHGLCCFFTVKYALFTKELSKYTVQPLKLEFDASIDWDNVTDLYDAVIAVKNGHFEESIPIFEAIFKGNNILIQRDAFYYYSLCMLNMDLDPCIYEFEEICQTSNKTQALLY